MFAHHASRSIKRVLLRIPTTAGANYAVDRGAFLRAYERGLLVDDLNVGPALKALGGRVAYSGARPLRFSPRGGSSEEDGSSSSATSATACSTTCDFCPFGRESRRKRPYHQKPLR